MTTSAAPARWAERVRRTLAPHLGVDRRALAALRIALGSLLVADLALRARDLTAFYTDAGVLPRAVLIERYPVARYSIHAVSGQAEVQLALFLLAAIVALALLVGYRSRLAAAASLVLLVSLQLRNPLVLNAGDYLLRWLLFWSVLLPCGARWSVDARRRDGARPAADGVDDAGSSRQDEPSGDDDGAGARDRVVGFATAGLLLQVLAVYVVNLGWKLRGDAWPSGRAVRMVFSLEQFVVLFGDALAGHPLLLEAIGRLWLALLVVSPLLIVLRRGGRTLLVVLLVGAHLGMAVTLRLGLFPFVAVAGLLPFLPGEIWQRIEDAIGGGDAGPRGPKRNTAGPSVASTGDSSGPSTVDRAATVAAAAALVMLLLWNASSLGYLALPQTDSPVADAVRSHPDWHMFAPEPPDVDGWYRVPAETGAGDRVDALHGGSSAVAFADGSAAYPDARWRKYLSRLRGDGADGRRRHLAAYLCDRWNRSRDGSLRALRLVFVVEATRLGEEESSTPVVLGRYDCGDATP